MLRLSPILFLFNGYWMLTNMQIFNDLVYPISTSKDIMLTGHKFDTVADVSQASGVLLIGIALTIIVIL